MALTFGNFKRMHPEIGGWRSGYVDITLDASYPAGGWPITAANLNLTNLYDLKPPAVGIGSSLAYPLRWDHATGKLLAFEGNAAAGTGMQEMDAADLSGEVIRCFYEGW